MICPPNCPPSDSAGRAVGLDLMDVVSGAILCVWNTKRNQHRVGYSPSSRLARPVVCVSPDPFVRYHLT